jgi:hypothetical protein
VRFPDAIERSVDRAIVGMINGNRTPFPRASRVPLSLRLPANFAQSGRNDVSLRRGAALGYFMDVGDFNGRGALTGAGDIIALGALMARAALMGCGPLTGRGPFIGASGRTSRGGFKKDI